MLDSMVGELYWLAGVLDLIWWVSYVEVWRSSHGRSWMSELELRRGDDEGAQGPQAKPSFGQRGAELPRPRP
jgi:hypothetical protein